MDIIIHDGRAIEEIQQEFAKEYPNLKVEFFAEARHRNPMPHPLHPALLMHPRKLIKECRQSHAKGMLSIHPGMAIEEVEEGFWNAFGLHARIYHKVGADWLEPATRHWSLEKQNVTSLESNAESTLERI